MSKWRNCASEEGSVEAMAHLREQNDEFCRRMRAAIERGIEILPHRCEHGPKHAAASPRLSAARLRL